MLVLPLWWHNGGLEGQREQQQWERLGTASGWLELSAWLSIIVVVWPELCWEVPQRSVF